MNSIVVKKLGGENAAKINVNLENVLSDYNKGITQAIILSAKRSPSFNATDKLIKTGETLKTGDKKEAEKIFQTVEDFNINIISKEIEQNNLLKRKKNKIINYTKKLFEEKRSIIHGYDDSFYAPEKNNDYLIKNEQKNFSILGFGENAEANIFSQILNTTSKTNKIIAEFVNLEDIINPNTILELPENEHFLYRSKIVTNAVMKIIDNNRIPIVPGYSGRFPKGIENTIGRGYSDATAAALSVGMTKIYESVELQIQKSVLGLLSGDPRIVGNRAKLIELINYISAKEITGSRGAQAKLLHSQVLRKEVLDAGVQVRIFDPENTNKGYKGTIISHKGNPKAEGIEFVGGKPNEVLISISLDNMSEPGLLNLIGTVLDKKNIAINQMSTSETSLTLTCCKNDNSNIDSAIKVLKKVLKIEKNSERNFITKDEGSALIYLIGQNMKGNKGMTGAVGCILKKEGININMITQGAEERAMIMSVDGKNRTKAIRALHKYFIEGIIPFTQTVTKQKKSLKISGKTLPNTKVIIKGVGKDIVLHSGNEGKFVTHIDSGLIPGKYTLEFFAEDSLEKKFEINKSTKIILEKEYLENIKKYSKIGK